MARLPIMTTPAITLLWLLTGFFVCGTMVSGETVDAAVISEPTCPAMGFNLSEAVIVAWSDDTIRLNAAEMLRDEIEKRTRIGL